MATDLKSQPRHELYVEEQLERASKRLHALDLGRIGLLLLAVLMAHALVMAVIDLFAGPNAASWAVVVRYGVWGLFLTAALSLSGLFLWRFSGKINPYYAAKEIEETIPDAKNSVVNWLDLKEEPLPPVVKTAIGLRAARDLKNTNPDQAIHPKKMTWILTVVIASLLVGLMALLVKEPGRFGSLMQRAFLPMIDSTLATRTRITLLQPAKGDLTVMPGQKIQFQARIAGVVPRLNTPQAARLLYRYQADESFVAVPLEEERDGTWAASLLSDQVQNGFSYKIVAGDTETAEYQVTVQSQPEAKRFELAYHYQPYTAIADRTVMFPNQDKVFPEIKGPVGTEVTVIVRTNRELHSGFIELMYANDSREIAGDVVSDDPKAFKVKFRLERTGQFRVHFTTRAGDVNADIARYEMHVIPDTAPTVKLTKPGKDIELPANGTLQLEGFVSDDFGITRVMLRMELFNGSGRIPLTPKIYRPDKSFKFQDGGYADRLEYRDFVVLSTLKDLIGDGALLAKGDVLSYWIEATDNCDYPPGQANVKTSDSFKVTIIDAEDAQKQRQEQDKAQREQKDHEKRQDEDLKQQERERRFKQQEQKRIDNPPDPARAAQEQKQAEDLARRVKEQIDKEKQEQGNQGAEKKELSGQDVDRLKKMLDDKGAVGDLAERELKNAAQGAKDDKVRQAAQEALKNHDKPAGEPSPEDIDKLKEMLGDKGKLGQAARDALDKAAKESKDPAARKAAEDALKNAGQQKNPEQPKELNEKDLAKLKEMLNDKGPLGDFARQQLKDAMKRSRDPNVSKGAQDALQKPLTQKDIEQLKDILNDKGPLGEAARQELDKAAKSADQGTSQAAKEALKNAQGKNPPAGSGQKQDISKEDIAKFKEMLNDKGPLGDFARQQLKNAMKQASDPAVSKEAQDALKNQTAPQPSAKDIEDFKELLGDKGPLADMAREQLSKMAKEAKDPVTKKSAENALHGAPPPETNKKPKIEPTEKDIAKLKEMMGRDGPQADAARRELEKAAAGARDPKVSDAAKTALKQDKTNAGKEPTKQDVDKLKGMLDGKGPVSDAAAQELAKIAKQSTDPGVQQAAKDALKGAGREDALQQPGSTQASPPRTEATRDVSLKEVEQFEKVGMKQGLLGDLAARELADASRTAKDEKVRTAAKDAAERLAKNKGAGKEPNLDDVDLLKEMLKDKGQLGDAAFRELSRLSTQAKDAKVRGEAAAALKQTDRKPAENDPVRDANKNNVDDLKKDRNKEGLLGDLARQGLSEIARNAKDPEVRKAAKEALKNRDPNKTEEVTPEDIDKLKNLIDDPGPTGEFVTREMARLAKEARDPQVREAAAKALKGSSRELKASAPDADAGNRSGSLNLDNLKKHVTPELLKKLGISEDEWRHNLKVLEDAQRARKDDPLAVRGDPNLLQGTGPRQVEPGTADSSSTTQGNRGQPPPGFRDVYDRWSSRRVNPDGK